MESFAGLKAGRPQPAALCGPGTQKQQRPLGSGRCGRFL